MDPYESTPANDQWFQESTEILISLGMILQQIIFINIIYVFLNNLQPDGSVVWNNFSIPQKHHRR
jgi:hypothetical protein